MLLPAAAKAEFSRPDPFLGQQDPTSAAHGLVMLI
jgi:hypothetical protein